MKKIPFPALNVSHTLGIIAVGAITGAVAGTAALITYSLLSSKGTATLLAAKTTLGLEAGATQTSPLSSLLSLLIPTSVGALGGGASGLSMARKQVGKIADQFQQQSDELRQQVQTLETKVTATQHASHPVREVRTIDLEKIKGIGPKFSHLLQEAGIYTVEDLAEQDAEALRCLLEPSSTEQFFKVEDWIAQAQHMMDKNKQVG